MPKNEIDIPAPRAEVWEVLLDPYAYVRWVVGGRSIRSVDEGWPQPGHAFHHTVGMWPLVLKDSTKVIDLRPQQRIVLEARARPAGIARVILTLEEVEEGTRVTLVEEPVSGPVTWMPDAAVELMTRARNAESLRRLRQLVEERTGASR